MTVKAYRADDGRFDEKGFKDEVANVNQPITRCRVRAHCQNSPAKNALVKLQSLIQNSSLICIKSLFIAAI